jgi:spermidine synthase
MIDLTFCRELNTVWRTQRKDNVMRFYLYAVAFIGGGVVLALEILGTRILGPFYGVSLFLWSALISITLAALTLGYAVGGRWADRRATVGRLSTLLGLAGTWTLLIPWLKYPVLQISEPYGLRVAVLVATFILFFPPLTLLGMISPFVIKLRARSLDEVGRSAGNLYAVSTVGSVIAALATGFILIPNIGVNLLVVSLSGLLFLTAGAGFLLLKKIGAAIGMFFLGAVTLATARAEDHRSEGLAGVYQSPYAEIRIVDTEDGRHMLIDGGIHTLIDTSTGNSRHPYTAVMEIPMYLTNRPGKMLLVGLGGGSLAKSYCRQGWKVDAVEIDPTVTEVAYRYFGLEESDATIYTMDGRQYVSTIETRYDLILLDAFGSSSIPFHLVTDEVFALIASRLRDGGILGINLESVGWRHRIVLSVAATLRRHFANIIVLPMAEPPNTIGNVVILASDEAFTLARELPRHYHDPFYRFSDQYHRNHAWDNQFIPPTEGVQIITDDLNPVDLWSEDVNFVARKNLHSYFEKNKLGW